MPFGPREVTKVEGVDLGDLVPIPGFDGYYITKSGRVFSIREISIRTDRDGYKRISTGRLRRGIHQLLAMVFLPSPSPGQTEVRHLDGIRDNNSLDNLAWGTRQENADDMTKHGSAKGEKNGNAVLTEVQVAAIRSMGGAKIKDLASMFGVSAGCIKQIRSGNQWAHVKPEMAKGEMEGMFE